MSKNNGQADTGPPFAVIGQRFGILSAKRIIETLQADALIQSKENLAAGPIFRETIDNFREWAKVAEPGNLFQAPEIKLRIIRLAQFAPLCTSLSEEARKQATPEPGEDRLKLTTE